MWALALLVLSGCGGEQSGAAEVVDRTTDAATELPSDPPSEGSSPQGGVDDVLGRPQTTR